MGALERDNHKIASTYTKIEASPLAVVDRKRICEMLGGEKGWKLLTAEKQKQNMKVIVDCVTRVSSSRHSKRYRDKLVYQMDDTNKLQFCYGTDGKSVQYEDSV